MSQEGDDWVAGAMDAAKAASPISAAIAGEIEQRLRGAISERELTKAEQGQLAKCLIALARQPSSEKASGED